MTSLYRCPWCVLVERGISASALMRSHILEAHRALLIMGLHPIESFDTRKPLDPPRNAAKPHPPRSPGVRGEGDSS